jgi:hypothetical protein
VKSTEVEQTLSTLPNVKFLDRIDGNDPYEISVNFAKYKSPKGEFGWGRNYGNKNFAESLFCS